LAKKIDLNDIHGIKRKMKTKNQNKPFFTGLTLVLLLAGCGLKGKLYQTPDAAPNAQVDVKTTTKASVKDSTSTIEKTENAELTNKVDDVELNGSGNPEHNENAHISKEHE
jgi:predicted small lipoprotein YifL